MLGASRPCWIDGSAALTMLTSSNVMNPAVSLWTRADEPAFLAWELAACACKVALTCGVEHARPETGLVVSMVPTNAAQSESSLAILLAQNSWSNGGPPGARTRSLRISWP